MYPHSNSTQVISKKNQQLIALFFLGIVLLGGFVAVYLVQRSQDLRNQAAVTAGMAAVSFSPSSSTPLEINKPQQIQVIAELPTDKKIDGIQYIADITGDIPFDLIYTPVSSIPGLTQVFSTLEYKDATTRTLKIAYLSANTTAAYLSPSPTLVLGTLTFTPSTNKALTIVPSTTSSKILENGTGTNIITNLSTVAYQICTTNCPFFTPVPTASATPKPATPSPTVAPTATPVPSPSNVPRSSSTPSPSPTSTAFPIPTNTPTPTTYNIADINQDGYVDLDDYSIWLFNISF